MLKLILIGISWFSGVGEVRVMVGVPASLVLRLLLMMESFFSKMFGIEASSLKSLI